MKKLLLLAIGLVLFAPAVVNAATMGFECDLISMVPGETRTCTFYVSDASAVSPLNITLIIPEKVTITSVNRGTGWVGDTNTIPNIALTATSATGRSAVFVLSYILADDWQYGEPCGISFIWNGQTISTPPITSSPNGTPPTDTENPQTGPDAIPYILIGAGAVIALSALYISTKKNKFYKI